MCLQVKSNHLRGKNHPFLFQRWDLSSLRSSGKAAGSAATPQDSTELTAYQSSRPPEKTSTHTCHRCSSATSTTSAELQKPFQKLQPQSSLGSPGTLARAAACFGDGTEDDGSIPARAAALPARAVPTAAVRSPSIRPTQLQRGRQAQPPAAFLCLPEHGQPTFGLLRMRLLAGRAGTYWYRHRKAEWVQSGLQIRVFYNF